MSQYHPSTSKATCILFENLPHWYEKSHVVCITSFLTFGIMLETIRQKGLDFVKELALQVRCLCCAIINADTDYMVLDRMCETCQHLSSGMKV